MRTIVTGGAGFLGRHLCRALAREGHEVRVIDLVENPEFPTTVADVRDADAMMNHVTNADAVFHLAALIEAGESVTYPQRFIDTNISGTVTVLEAMKQNGIPIIIFSSSAAVYGEPQRVPIREDDRTLPINPYGMTKLAVEGLLSSYVESHQLTAVALRYFNLYGPEEHHEPETHGIPRFIKQIYEGSEVTVWGNGEHQRDYVFISDIVDAHLKALAHAQDKPNMYHYFNLSTEKPNSVREVIETIESIMGTTANVRNFPPRPGDPMVLTADATKARDQLRWEARIDLSEGLRQTIAYFQDIWRRYDGDTKNH